MKCRLPREQWTAVAARLRELNAMPEAAQAIEQRLQDTYDADFREWDVPAVEASEEGLTKLAGIVGGHVGGNLLDQVRTFQRSKA